MFGNFKQPVNWFLCGFLALRILTAKVLIFLDETWSVVLTNGFWCQNGPNLVDQGAHSCLLEAHKFQMSDGEWFCLSALPLRQVLQFKLTVDLFRKCHKALTPWNGNENCSKKSGFPIVPLGERNCKKCLGGLPQTLLSFCTHQDGYTLHLLLHARHSVPTLSVLRSRRHNNLCNCMIGACFRGVLVSFVPQ